MVSSLLTESRCVKFLSPIIPEHGRAHGASGGATPSGRGAWNTLRVIDTNV